MDDKLGDYLLKAAAGVLTLLGLVAVLVGYLGVRDQSNIELQIPYLVSGGLGGLALVGLGALALIQYQMRLQARRFADLTHSLDAGEEQAPPRGRPFLREPRNDGAGTRTEWC